MIEWSYSLIGSSVTPGVPGGDFSGKDTGGIQYVQLALDAAGDVKVPFEWLRGPAAVVQRVRIRFRLWRGEWFLDQRIGVPYRENVLVKNPDKPLVSALFRRVMADTPGVANVESLDATYDRRARSVLIDARATLTDGALLVIQSEPFIVGTS